MDKKHSKVTIGRKDVANFPLLELFQVNVKIDTGAYTSSIHCKSITEKEGKLYCVFLDEKHPEYSLKTHSFDNYKTITVKSSNGIAENRYEILSKIELFNKTYPIYLSLTNRGDMKFPVLLGRRFLKLKFVVDPSLKDLSLNIKI